MVPELRWISPPGQIFYGGKRVQKGSGNPRDHTEIAFLVDVVQCEDGFIVKTFLPDADPAELVTDYFYFFNSILHRDSAYLAGDTIKRWVRRTDFSA